MKSPLEDVFNIEEDTTGSMFPKLGEQTDIPEVMHPLTGEVITMSVDDDQESVEKAERVEDLQLQAQYNTIYRQALSAFETQSEMAQTVDPQFSARNAEVAAQYLTIALNATKDRTEAKFKRAKTNIAKGNIGNPATVNNNLIVANRNDLLKMLSNSQPKVIENETN